MNHNGTIDRFENDEEADLPYQRDHKGSMPTPPIHPDVRLTVADACSRKSSRRQPRPLCTGYSRPQLCPLGRVRLFQDLRKVRDTIADDLIWPHTQLARRLFPVPDERPARNTVINTTWIGWQVEPLAGLHIGHKIKSRAQPAGPTTAMSASRTAPRLLFGAVNQAEYQLNLRQISMPGWKSEYIHQKPVSRTISHARVESVFMLLTRLPILRRAR